MVQKIQNKKEYIIISIESDSRKGLNHEVIYNTETGEWSCECEDYTYRKRICKHIKKAYAILKDMGYELKEELYIGEKVTFPIENKTSQDVEVIIEDLTQVQVLMELLNIKEQVLSIKENNTDDINEINNILKSVNKLIVSHS